MLSGGAVVADPLADSTGSVGGAELGAVSETGRACGAAEGGDRDRQSLPGLRLIELAARLEPGDTVPVEYGIGASTAIGTLPPGTSYASFAATLVG